MKKLYLISFLAAFAIFARGQTIFSEGFETWPPTGWTLIDNDNDGHNWYQGSDPIVVHGGSHCAVSDSYDDVNFDSLTPDNWLITPQIDLSGVSTAYLSWWVYSQDQSWPEEHYSVFLSTTTNSISAFTTVLFSETMDAYGEYINRVLNISAYAGQMVYIAFVHDSVTDQWKLDLDDVSVTGSIGIQENVIQPDVNIFPNPVTDILNVVSEEKINKAEIYNSIGQLIRSKNINMKSAWFNIEGLTSGMYVLNIETDHGIYLRKFSIR